MSLFQVQEMESTLPPGCRVKFEDPNSLHDFVLIVSPEAETGGGSGSCPWQGGKYRFHVVCSEEYNIVPPTVKCLTKIWHPNINEGKQSTSLKISISTHFFLLFSHRSLGRITAKESQISFAPVIWTLDSPLNLFITILKDHLWEHAPKFLLFVQFALGPVKFFDIP